MGCICLFAMILPISLYRRKQLFNEVSAAALVHCDAAHGGYYHSFQNLVSDPLLYGNYFEIDFGYIQAKTCFLKVMYKGSNVVYTMRTKA